MTGFDMLMQMAALLPPRDGWVCRSISKTKVVMEHPELGRRVGILVSGRQMVVREPATDAQHKSVSNHLVHPETH